MINQRKEIFKKRFEQHYPRLCNIALGYVPSRQDAEDIVQELFINVWNRGKDTLDEADFYAYMTTSVRNCCISFLRKKKFSTISIDNLAKIPCEHPFDTCSTEETATEDHLQAALKTLPERCQQIFLLNKLKGKKYREIAQETGLSEKTVEHHIAKAMKMLRAYAANHQLALLGLLYISLQTFLKK